MSSLLFSSVGTPTPVVVQKRRQRIIRAHSSFRSFPSFSVLDETASFSTQNKSNTEKLTRVAAGERTNSMMFRKRNNSNSNNDNKILKSVLLVQTVLVLLSTSSIAHALEANEQTESNAFVQTLLQKTEEKREERQKERVLEYSKKNFKDYLAFVDNGRTAKTENDVKIKEWLEKNK